MLRSQTQPSSQLVDCWRWSWWTVDEDAVPAVVRKCSRVTVEIFFFAANCSCRDAGDRLPSLNALWRYCGHQGDPMEMIRSCATIHPTWGRAMARHRQARAIAFADDGYIDSAQRMLAHSRRIEGGMRSRPATRQVQALHQVQVTGRGWRARQVHHQC